jgi:hypothetical protein
MSEEKPEADVQSFTDELPRLKTHKVRNKNKVNNRKKPLPASLPMGANKSLFSLR